MPVVTITLNPAIDQTLSIPGFAAGRVNRVAASQLARRRQGGERRLRPRRSRSGGRRDRVPWRGEPRPVRSGFRQSRDRRSIRPHPWRTRVGPQDRGRCDRRRRTSTFPGSRRRKRSSPIFSSESMSSLEPGGWLVLSGSVPAGMPDGIYARDDRSHSCAAADGAAGHQWRAVARGAGERPGRDQAQRRGAGRAGRAPARDLRGRPRRRRIPAGARRPAGGGLDGSRRRAVRRSRSRSAGPPSQGRGAQHGRRRGRDGRRDRLWSDPRSAAAGPGAVRHRQRCLRGDAHRSGDRRQGRASQADRTGGDRTSVENDLVEK